MADFKHDINTVVFQEAVKSLKLRFPIAEISKQTNYAKGNISNFLKGKKSVPDNFLDNFLEVFNLDKDDFTQTENKTHIAHSISQGYPLLTIEAVAGFNAEDNVGVSYENCEHYVVPEFDKSGVEFLIRVSGSSMYPKYSNGDILACKKINEITFFQWGKIYVIDSNQGALVKRIFEDKDNPDNILCVSDNKENYPHFSMPKNDIRSLSIVLGVVRME